MKHGLRGRPNRLDARSPLTLRAQRIGLTLYQLAERVGYTPGSLEHVAAGRELPSAKRWPRWAVALEMPLGELVALFRELTRGTALDGEVDARLAAVEDEQRDRLARLDRAAGRVARLRAALADAESRVARLVAEEDEVSASLAALRELAPRRAPTVVVAGPSRRRAAAGTAAALSADERDLLARLRGAA